MQKGSLNLKMINYLTNSIEEPRYRPIEVQFAHLLPVEGWDHALEEFLATAGFSSMEALRPRTLSGLSEVPSLEATVGVASLLVALLNVALDLDLFFLVSGSDMAFFPFESVVDMPFLMGEMSRTSS